MLSLLAVVPKGNVQRVGVKAPSLVQTNARCAKKARDRAILVKTIKLI